MPVPDHTQWLTQSTMFPPPYHPGFHENLASMPPQPHSSMEPGQPYIHLGMCAMGHPCMCAQHRPQAAHFYQLPLTSQPVTRKRGRPRGSKDVVPRARKFTLVKKNHRKSSPAHSHGELATNKERSGDDTAEEDGADTRSSRDGNDDATSSAQEACDEKSMRPGPGLEEPPIAVANAKASASLESLWSFDTDIAPKGQFSQQSGELELVDQDWFQNHEQLFGRRKNVS
jgi:hypothetical protein